MLLDGVVMANGVEVILLYVNNCVHMQDLHFTCRVFAFDELLVDFFAVSQSGNETSE